MLTLGIIAVVVLVASATDARVIAVAGWNTTGAPCEPRGIPARCIGLFESARVLAGPGGVVSPHTLPGASLQGGLVDAGVYASVELAVWTSARAVLSNIESVEPVILIGHSHGAILVLRVAHQLAQESVPLQRLRVVTVDPIVLGYPFPVFLSVPCGVSQALNVYQTIEQTIDPHLKGARVRNATNVNVSDAIRSERTLGNLIDPDDERFMPALLAPDHTFIDDSFTVRRRMLAWFNQDTAYLPGFWQWTMTGRVGSGGPFVEFGGLTLLDYTDDASRGFFARELVHVLGSRKTFRGAVSSGTLSGIFRIPVVAFGGQAASGFFVGTTDFRHRIDLQVAGDAPVRVESLTLLEPFTGTASFERIEFDALAEFIPDACPEILLTLNGALFHSGQRLMVGQHLRNPGPQHVVDLYLGFVLPDGTLLFVTSLAPFEIAVGRVDDISSYFALQTKAFVPEGSDITVPNLLSYAFTGDEPEGTYVIFAAVTEPEALKDGRIDPGDILSSSFQAFAFSR